MDRRYSIKYRPGISREQQQQRVAQSALNTTYDSTTDNDIFALGDAATGFNIDDLFKDFGMSPQPGTTGSISTDAWTRYDKSQLPVTQNSKFQKRQRMEQRLSPDELPSSSSGTVPISDTVPISGTLPPKGHTLIETSTISPQTSGIK